MKRGGFFRAGWPPAAAVILFLAFWQAIVSMGSFPHYILPGPAAVVNAFLSDAPLLGGHTLSTFTIAVIGFLIGSTVGLAVAFLLHLVSLLRSALSPLLILSQNVPIVVLAPLLVVWFGYGTLPKLILLTLVCFFPVAIATLDGLSRADRSMMAYMRMAGASRWQTFTKLEFPWSMSAMFSGLKLSAAYSVLGAVISEWVGAERGLGVYLNLKKSGFQVDHMFVAIMIIACLSLVMFMSIVGLERLLIRWRHDQG